jgi:hypothetical protein
VCIARLTLLAAYRSFVARSLLCAETDLVTADDNCVAPLYEHLFPPGAPSLSFIGLPWKVLVRSMPANQRRQQVLTHAHRA